MLEENSIIEQFRVHKHKQSEIDESTETADTEDVRRRISYTREQKLEAINYATITCKTQKNESTKLISKYAAAKDLDITSTMLRD
jgi:hypothetical protein